MSEIDIQTRIDGGEIGAFYRTGGGDSVFVVTYGETPAEDIKAAIAAKKVIMVKDPVTGGNQTAFFYAAYGGPDDQIDIQCGTLIQGGFIYRQISIYNGNWSTLEWYVQGDPM